MIPDPAAWIPKALTVARRYAARHPGEDPESAALLGLAKAFAAWDPARGLAFSTLAYTCIHNELIRDREWWMKRRGWALEADGLEADRVAALSTPAADEGVGRHDEVMTALRWLHEPERAAVWGMVAEERSGAEMARECGVSREAMRVRKVRGLRRLREWLGVDA